MLKGTRKFAVYVCTLISLFTDETGSFILYELPSIFPFAFHGLEPRPMYSLFAFAGWHRASIAGNEKGR